MEALEAEIVALSAHLDAATFRLLTSLRQFDASGEWANQGAKSCAHWLMWRTGVAAGVAREKVRVARALEHLPLIGRALETGELSYSKVRALTRVARPDNEATPLDFARKTTAAQLERICRGYRSVQGDPRVGAAQRDVTFRQTDDGMVRMTATLHPDEAEIVWSAVQDAARKGGAEARAQAQEAQDGGRVSVEAEETAAGGARSREATEGNEGVPAEIAPGEAWERGKSCSGAAGVSCRCRRVRRRRRIHWGRSGSWGSRSTRERSSRSGTGGRSITTCAWRR